MIGCARSLRLVFPLLCAVLLASGCAVLRPAFDPPKITLESFDSLPTEGGAPRFAIRLRVINPNKQALDIAGISYGVEFLGKELISGVTHEVPLIEGYSEQVVTLETRLQLFQLVSLLADLGQRETDALDYRLTAKVDFNGFLPTQRIEERGQIRLAP